MSKKTRNIIIAVAILVVLIAGAVTAYVLTRPAPQEGAKTVEVAVIHGDESRRDLSIHTDADNLRGALEQEDLIAGEESAYGLYVTAVDGETADESLQQWWCFTKDGEMLSTGVDDTMISDGDRYEITLTTGW